MDNELLDYKVLFIEDDKEINQRVTARLKRYFKHVDSVFNAEDGYVLYLDKRPDIIFIDVNLPKMNGLNLLKKIREKDHNTKAVMLTAKSDIDTVLQSTSLKLTKYLIKPLNRKDLEETILLLKKEITDFKVINENNFHFSDNYFWNVEKSELKHNSNIVTLTPNENKLFQTFIKNINRILSYDDLSLELWDDFNEDKNEALKTTIKNLRKKIPKDLIQNEYGIGYKLIY